MQVQSDWSIAVQKSDQSEWVGLQIMYWMGVCYQTTNYVYLLVIMHQLQQQLHAASSHNYYDQRFIWDVLISAVTKSHLEHGSLNTHTIVLSLYCTTNPTAVVHVHWWLSSKWNTLYLILTTSSIIPGYIMQAATVEMQAAMVQTKVQHCLSKWGG